MYAKSTRAVRAALVFVSGAVGSLGCGGVGPVEKESNTGTPANASITRTVSNANTSASGSVKATLGDFLVNVRTDSLISHVFQEAQPGFPEQLFLRYFVETETGQNLFFEYSYTDGTRSSSVSENGFITITKNGTEFVGKAGTVTIEPVGTRSVKVSFDKLAVAPVAAATHSSMLDFIGNGAVEGPTRKVCIRAGEVVAAENVPTPPPAVPVHDEAWIGEFCGP